MSRISLDQWQAFIAVNDAGSYARAAETLHKSQSSITYAVQKIEDLLDVKLFEMDGRRARLTETGSVLLLRARSLVDEAERVESAAASLAAGREPEIRIAVDALFPTWLLLECLQQFTAEYPDVRLELYESVLDGTNELLLQGEVQLAITSLVPPGFLGDLLMDVPRVAVAAPDHPLHGLDRPVTPEDLRCHRHILVRDSGSQRSRNPAWEGSHQRLVVSHKATSIRALCMGLGYAWVACDIVRNELDEGVLKPLPLQEGAERASALYLVHAGGFIKGPGLTRLEAIIRDALPARDMPS